jgi:hypothetical protein
MLTDPVILHLTDIPPNPESARSIPQVRVRRSESRVMSPKDIH